MPREIGGISRVRDKGRVALSSREVTLSSIADAAFA